jgi:hypothetical protein
MHALTAVPALAQQPAASAKASLAAADKAAKSKDWATAQAQYRAAYDASPSAQALNGLANASYELKAWPEAYEAYDEFVRTYPDAMGRTAKALAEKRMKEIEAKTGALTILVNEPGADVTLDDKKLGTSPVKALVRVATGTHRVRVTKPGFSPFEKTLDVAANAKLSVDANLSRASKSGKVSVKESAGQPVRVVIDGVDVGPAPYEGELAPGSHEIAVRSATLGSPTQRVEVEAGKTADVTVAASSALGHLEINTSDGLGIIYLDGKVVGEGHFAGDAPAGSHDIRVTREGFVPFEKKVELAEKQSASETVTLRTAGQSLEAVKVEESRPFYGLYGGFGLMGGVGIGGLGSSLDATDESCKALGALSCDTPGPLGAGLFGYVGFTWLPVGVELFVGGLFDSTSQSADYPPPDPANTSISGPSRTEKYSTVRVGGVAAIRARATLDGKLFRVSLAAGPGIAYKQLAFDRKTETANGYSERYVPDDGATNPGASEPNKLHYVSPAIVADLSVHFRLTPTAAISVGLLGWLEAAGNDTVAQADLSRALVSNAPGAQPIGLRTPRYELASGAQFFLGPQIGMMFGP